MDEKKVLDILETARETGKIRKGVNEATKSIERGEAKLVIAAEDVNPPEIVMHLPMLCDEKKIAFVKIAKKVDLGRAVGIDVGTSAVAIVDAGEASNELKKILEIKQE